MLKLGRRFVCALAAALAFAAPAYAQTTLKVSLHSDLKIVDPIWTTALITTHHGNMVYDTLFALDDKLAGQAADGRQVGGLARQAHLDLHPARRPGMARRQAGDGRGLRRLDQALGRQGFDGPEADGRGRPSSRRPTPRPSRWC